MPSPSALFLLTVFAAARPGGSTVAFDPLGRGTWTVDQENDEIDLISGTGELRRFQVGVWPEQLAVAEDGTVYVSCRASGHVAVIAPAFEVSAIPVGAEPRALVLDEEGAALYVALVTERAVAKIDTRRGVVVKKRALELDPWAMALTPAGIAVAGSRDDTIFFLPRSLADDPAPAVTLAAKKGRAARRPWHIQALAADGDALYAVHAFVDTGLARFRPFGGGGYGGSFDPPIEMAVSLIRAPASPSRPALVGPIGDLEVKDVQGAVVQDRMLYVASRGTKQLVVAAIDEDRRLSPSEARNLGNGVSGVAVSPDGGELATLIAFDRYLATLRVRPDARAVLVEDIHHTYGSNSVVLGVIEGRLHPLARATKTWIGLGRFDDQLARGRTLFYDALNLDVSNKGFACASCHPDGREDGLVWRIERTRRQTPMLAGRIEGTAPFNWEGTTKTLEENIDQTITRLGGMGLELEERRALARFVVEGLRRPTLPASNDPQAMIARGEHVFHDPAVGCASCHPSSERYADGEDWDVKVRSVEEAEAHNDTPPPRKKPLFNTPSLHFVRLTAPYFHDGSAKTLDALIEENADRMGTTSMLDSEDKRALVAYLSSL